MPQLGYALKQEQTKLLTLLLNRANHDTNLKKISEIKNLVKQKVSQPKKKSWNILTLLIEKYWGPPLSNNGGFEHV